MMNILNYAARFLQLKKLQLNDKFQFIGVIVKSDFHFAAVQNRQRGGPGLAGRKFCVKADKL